jgi:hypothetical protein
MNTENNLQESTEQALTIPVISKRIDFKADEIAFILKLVQWNIDYAPEENTANEIDLTNRIQTKLIM